MEKCKSFDDNNPVVILKIGYHNMEIIIYDI